MHFGKHRGVAVGELVTVGLDKLFFDGTDDKSSGKVVLCNLSENDHWYGTCKGRCDWCSLKNKAANDKRTDNVATAVRKIKEVMNASPVTTRVTPKFYKFMPPKCTVKPPPKSCPTVKQEAKDELKPSFTPVRDFVGVKKEGGDDTPLKNMIDDVIRVGGESAMLGVIEKHPERVCSRQRFV